MALQENHAVRIANCLDHDQTRREVGFGFKLLKQFAHMIIAVVPLQ